MIVYMYELNQFKIIFRARACVYNMYCGLFGIVYLYCLSYDLI